LDVTVVSATQRPGGALSELATLQPILNTAIDAVVVMDASGRIIDWNVRAEGVFGWRRDEVLGRPLGETIVPERFREGHRRGLQRLLATGEQVVLGKLIELSALRRDGGEFPVELSLSAYGAADAPIFLGFIRDISERQETIARLAVSEARFRAAVEAVQGVLWTNNAAGEMSGEQLGWAKLTGQTQAEYQGFGWAQAVHPDDAAPTVEAWNAAVVARRPFIFEHRVRNREGVWRDFAIRAIPTFDDDGAIREWIGVHTDITEQKQGQARLRESEARFRTMADSAPAPVWITGVDGGVEFVNAAFADFFGRSRDSLLGDTWIALIHPEDVAAIGARRAAAWVDLSSYTFEGRFRRNDGVYRWMVANAKPRIDMDGRFQGYVGLAMDLSDVKAAELRQRLLINELNHRVKNTLASVQSIARQTLRADETPIHVREQLLDRLLAMSAAHDVLTRESWEGADIHEVVHQAVRPFTDDHDSARILIEGPDLRIGPNAALALSLALHELGTNAVKYGAFSSLTGSVTINWDLASDGLTAVRWKETGGPWVSAPTRKGFGSRLLDGGLTADLGGRPQLIFARDGVEAVLPIRVTG
jgi:PAS domain S-box-containing protein